MRCTVLGLLALVALLPSVSARAQDGTHPVESLDLDSHVDWMRGGAVFLDGRRAKRELTEEEQAVDRGALLDKAIERARGEQRLVLWYIPRIIESTSRGRQMYRAPVLDVYMRQVLFCDQDVSSILRHRFVPLRMVCDEALSERLGYRPLEFIEPAVVFLDGAGRVVHHVERIRTFDALWFADLLLRVSDAAGVDGDVGAGDLSIEDEVARGRYRSALGRLAALERPGVDDLLAAAAILRRLRDPEAALERLAEAQALLDRPPQGSDGERPPRNDPRVRERRTRQARLDLERGRILTLTGDRSGALALLDGAFRRAASPEDAAQAGYLLALNRLALGDEAGAMRQFQIVAARHPGTLAGRKALANVTIGPDDRPIGAAFSGFEHVGYLPAAAYEGLPLDTTWAGADLSPRSMAVAAVRVLLDQQRDDGGFTDARYAYWGSSEITPNTWVAISALACTALLEFRDLVADEIDPALIDEAVDRAEDYIFDPKHLNRGKNEEVYADAYRILYLARLSRHWSERKPWAVERMGRLAAEASARQSADGFFAHEYRNAFCTGAMLWSLLEAVEIGVELPADMIERGAAALESARGENGAYAYGGTAESRSATLKDAAGRMPLCEAVLLRTGDGSAARLSFAIDNFWEYFDRIEGVRRNDFHSDGELAGFFFFHDLFHTSEVLPLLPGELRAVQQARFLEVLQDIPEMDGSFVDSHEFGRSYGTAMALLTLRNAVEW